MRCLLALCRRKHVLYHGVGVGCSGLHLGLVGFGWHLLLGRRPSPVPGWNRNCGPWGNQRHRLHHSLQMNWCRKRLVLSEWELSAEVVGLECPVEAPVVTQMRLQLDWGPGRRIRCAPSGWRTEERRLLTFFGGQPLVACAS